MNAPSSPLTASRVETDILLVGLGPVGAALANLLGRYGVRVLAIDKATAIFEKLRAIALDNEALRILQAVGVRDSEFETVAIPQVQYRSPLFGRFARMNTAGIIDGHPALVTFYQPELERLPRAKLAQYPRIEVQLGVELQSFVDNGRFVQRCVLAEGPASESEALLRRALELVAPRASAPAATVPDRALHIQGAHHAA